MPKLAGVLLLLLAGNASAHNLLRNASFEGGGKYWLTNGAPWLPDRGTGGQYLRVTADANAPHGSHVLEMHRGGVRSVPFRLEPGSRVVVSCSARTDGPAGTFEIALSPTLDDRRKGVPPFGVRGEGTGWKTQIGLEWKRLSWTIDIPPRGWKWSGPGAGFNWDGESWFLAVRGMPKQTVFLDAVRISSAAAENATQFVPATPVEVTIESPAVTNKNYQSHANIFERGATVPVHIALANHTAAERAGTLRLDLLNYDGTHVFSSKTMKYQTAPGKRQELAATLELDGAGLLLARAIALDAGGAELSRSDQPFTVLAFPKNATTPEFSDRIGGTVVNGHKRIAAFEDVARKIGYGWTRWYPNTSWRRIQPNGPDEWLWPDDIIDNLLARGVSINAVWYGCPQWAASSKARYIPKDMADWDADDKRWDDLSIETLWDKFLIAAMKRYKGKSIAWELINEPEFSGGPLLGGGEQGGPGFRRWEARFYTNFVRRSYKRIKSMDPNAVVLISGVNGGIDAITRQFLALGGAPYADVYSYHTYTPGTVSSPEIIRGMYKTFRDAGAPEGFSLWFNEGWTTYPTSEDWPAHVFHADRNAVAVADMVVRSVVECFAAGLEKLILFNTAYPGKGRSLWDWSGDGTEWYDDNDNPTVAVPLYNVMIDQIGRSRHVRSLHINGATVHVFDDLRHNRGVAVVWPDPVSEVPNGKAWRVSQQGGRTVTLPAKDIAVLDVMGMRVEASAGESGTTIAFPRAGKPVYVFSNRNITGAELARALDAK